MRCFPGSVIYVTYTPSSTRERPKSPAQLHPGVPEPLTIPRVHVRAPFTQQMGKNLSPWLLIERLRPISGLPLGQNGPHLISHDDSVLTDVQSSKAAS